MVKIVPPREAAKIPANLRTDARRRFRGLDPYRVNREWARYEGTAQRELFRSLRERFLERHAVPAGRVLEIGPGPGRFTSRIGQAGTSRTVLDLSFNMLREVRTRWADVAPAQPLPHLIRGDAARPPFVRRSFEEVAALGNSLGFSGNAVEGLWTTLIELVRPGGTLVLEVAPGPGGRSRYLCRLPVGAVRRTLAAPLQLVLSRVRREGFRSTGLSKAELHGFRRFGPAEISERLRKNRFRLAEVMAVAPALGHERDRLKSLRRDLSVWKSVVELEELLGHDPEVLGDASALLVAARAPDSHVAKNG